MIVTYFNHNQLTKTIAY